VEDTIAEKRQRSNNDANRLMNGHASRIAPRGQRLSPEGKASRTLGFPVAEEHVERDFEGFQNFVVQKRYLSDVV
jgi:hypothetical protein